MAMLWLTQSMKQKISAFFQGGKPVQDPKHVHGKFRGRKRCTCKTDYYYYLEKVLKQTPFKTWNWGTFETTYNFIQDMDCKFHILSVNVLLNQRGKNDRGVIQCSKDLSWFFLLSLSNSQSLEEEWKNTFKLLDVQWNVFQINYNLGSHIICWWQLLTWEKKEGKEKYTAPLFLQNLPHVCATNIGRVPDYFHSTALHTMKTKNHPYIWETWSQSNILLDQSISRLWTDSTINVFEWSSQSLVLKLNGEKNGEKNIWNGIE